MLDGLGKFTAVTVCAEQSQSSSCDALVLSLPSGRSDILVIFSLIFLILPLMSTKGRFAVGDFSVIVCCQWDGNGGCFAPCPHSFIPCLLFWVSKQEPGFGAWLSGEGMLQVSPPELAFWGGVYPTQTHCTFKNLVFMS